jgi:predicted ATPase
LQHLGTAVRSHLVTEQAELLGEGYAFGHVLIQQTVYSGLPRHRLRHLHRRVGAALEALRPTAWPDLARHFAAAGDPERAVEYALSAGAETASRGGHAEAEQYYRTALSLLEATHDRAMEADVCGLLAYELSRLNRLDDALQTYGGWVPRTSQWVPWTSPIWMD